MGITAECVSRETVLVGVLKSKRDLAILRNEHWYRIPVAHLPHRRFAYIAFYQPAIFGREGKCIHYYARVLDSRLRGNDINKIKCRTFKRSELLADELWHPKAHENYARIDVGPIRTLPRPIKNSSPRRVSFGFTTRERLLRSKNILQLYRVPETEEIVRKELRRADIPTIAQHWITGEGKRYRLDFAVFCNRGAIAIECDNRKAHMNPRQKEKDRAKDAFLTRRGWAVLRLKEEDIMIDPRYWIPEMRRIIKTLGGLIPD
ncbi:MAG: hypothetical protein A2946_03655 [Candidatus Liptonbacteria bacterium RIFCSPLOWO2_01_FULL_53_13]|uniref:Restriction endonuclease type II-like domain-containing protein n=1 Tax=Candidatus Liptonbacteria bacterium RIFCSPLOWO2_01_FULL_53_13 TaxID=1798651 RepID=A0A1G2CJV7_9BACT|nr:MAG: hypothetical protein A2946_03655 [Candidatus Liptonbacteria bacterium RIFCSPLOWO2_01_FULL_53_13]